MTRFVNADDLAEPLRRWVARHLGYTKWYLLITCPWCLSIWVAGALVPLGWYAGRSPAYLIPAAVLTMSYVYALTANHLDSGGEE